MPCCHAKELPRDEMPSEEQLLHIPGEAVSCLTSRDLSLHSCKALLRRGKGLPRNPKPRQDPSHPCPGCQSHCTVTFCANEIQNLLSCSHAELKGKKINGSYRGASSVLVEESEIPIEACRDSWRCAGTNSTSLGERRANPVWRHLRKPSRLCVYHTRLKGRRGLC